MELGPEVKERAKHGRLFLGRQRAEYRPSAEGQQQQLRNLGELVFISGLPYFDFWISL
jgi:hypothetical protein